MFTSSVWNVFEFVFGVRKVSENAEDCLRKTQSHCAIIGGPNYLTAAVTKTPHHNSSYTGKRTPQWFPDRSCWLYGSLKDSGSRIFDIKFFSLFGLSFWVISANINSATSWMVWALIFSLTFSRGRFFPSHRHFDFGHGHRVVSCFPYFRLGMTCYMLTILASLNFFRLSIIIVLAYLLT